MTLSPCPKQLSLSYAVSGLASLTRVDHLPPLSVSSSHRSFGISHSAASHNLCLSLRLLRIFSTAVALTVYFTRSLADGAQLFLSFRSFTKCLVSARREFSLAVL